MDMRTRQASTLPGSHGFYSPRWSPDGRYLAALAFENNSLMLYDFKTQKRSAWVTGTDLGYPSWSSDSRYVYYESIVAGRPVNSRLMVGVHRPEVLFSVQGLRRYFGYFAFWSGQAPDNSRLFTRDVSTQEIYALDVDFP